MFTRRFSPFDDMMNTLREFDNFFRRSMPTGNLGHLLTGEATPWAGLLEAPNASAVAPLAFIPPVETLIKDGRCFVKAELPGVKPEDLKVDVADGVLTISGERRSEIREEDAKYFRRESVYGTFSRSFRLPEEVDTNTVKASFKNGVLDVSFAVPKQVLPRTVKVEIEGAEKKAIAAA